MNTVINHIPIHNYENNINPDSDKSAPVLPNINMRESQCNILDDTPTFTEALKRTTCILYRYRTIVTHTEGVILRALWLKFSRSLENEIPISTFYKLLKSCTNSNCPSALYLINLCYKV